jgi:FKBP-type peptidyl-prolyl cis-trans isomerase FkpA
LTSGFDASLGDVTETPYDVLSLSKKGTKSPTTKSPSPSAGRSTPLSRRDAGATVAASVAFAWSIPNAVHAKDLGEEYRQGTAALSDSDDTAPVPREAYKKLESGVIYADLRPGAGDTVKQGSKVNLQWVLRKSNGYFVDSSATHDSVPFIFTVGDGTAIQGLDEAVRGMKEGGVRRVLIPPSLAYVTGLDDGKPGPLPYGYGPRQQMRRVQNIRKDVPGEYVYLEVQATRVR